MDKELFKNKGLQIFKECGTWNGGDFHDKMTEFFKENNIDVKKANSRMEKAFTYYLAGNSSSKSYLIPALGDIFLKCQLTATQS